jgi:uncharacterized protein YraI
VDRASASGAEESSSSLLGGACHRLTAVDNSFDYNYQVLYKLKFSLLASLLALSSTGCGLNVSSSPSPTPTLLIITSTLPATPSARPSETPAPPTPAPTVAPVEGTTTTQVNVRGEPSTASPALGILDPFSKVQIAGKDAGGNWYQIIYAAGPEGRGWVTAIYIQTTGQPDVPVIGGGSGEDGGNTAIAIQQINVRSGPGTDFNSLGTVNAQDVVTLTGKNPNGTWLQIEFAAGPEGKGWVNAAFVQVTGLQGGNLPIITEAGEVVGTGTPTGIPPTITPTIVPSAQDDDSAASPAVHVYFSPSGSRALFYTSDVSSPDGDAEDWVGFTPYGSAVSMHLECEGNGTLKVELWRAGQAVPDWEEVSCNSGEQLILVSAGQPYLVHLQAQPAEEGLESVRYTLSISTV